MSRLARLTILTLLAAAIAGLWVSFGMLTAIAVAFTMLAYCFVWMMRTAADEIRRYEREQRPDLHA